MTALGPFDTLFSAHVDDFLRILRLHFAFLHSIWTHQVDEAHNFFADKDENVLDRIAREAHKFGVALIAASQSPTHFSEDFISNVGTKLLLGLDSLYFDGTVRKMKIDKETLGAVVPGKVAAIQTSVRGEQSPQFRLVRVSG